MDLSVFMPFLAEAVSSGGAASYVSEAVLMLAIARLFTELRGETRQSREDKVTAISALDNATVSSSVAASELARLKSEVEDLRETIGRLNSAVDAIAHQTKSA